MGRYLEYTKGHPTPEVFRLWTAIHGIGSAVERRVWTEMGLGLTYPNIFVFLVGPPNIGKSYSMAPMIGLLRKSGACEIAPNDVSKQGLLDSLSKAGRGAIYAGEPFDYHYMAMYIAEILNFMPKYDVALAGILTDLWDCPEYNDESKRHGLGKMIEFPGVSLIMGAATESLGNVIGNEMWGTGFMARVILVHSEDVVIPADIFAKQKDSGTLAAELELRLERLGDLKGPMEWTPEAMALHQGFTEAPDNPPPHERLYHYNARRPRHMTKLAMIAALSDERMIVDADAYNTARSWLLAAENTMSGIFGQLTSHEDAARLQELAYQVRQLYLKRLGAPVDAQELKRLLTKLVHHTQVNSMLEIAVAADYIRRVAGTTGDNAQYVPTKKGE